MRTAENEEVALVTGASRGIGRAVAIELARRGYRLCLAARSREQLEQTRQLTELAPADSLIVLLDLAEEDSPQALIETALDHFGRLDVLINNAGWAPPRSALIKTSSADQDRMIAVNLRAPIALSRLAASRMVEQGTENKVALALEPDDVWAAASSRSMPKSVPVPLPHSAIPSV